MSQHAAHTQFQTALRHYAAHLPPGGNATSVLACLFALVGVLFTLNFGLTLIAIAAAILFYRRFGQRIAAALGGVLLAMLAVWMIVIPSHYLIPASIIVLLGAAASLFAAKRRLASQPAWTRQDLLAAPVYALVKLREKLIGNPRLGPS